MKSKHSHIRASIKTYAIGNYIQSMKYLIHEETGILGIQHITCTCRYSTIHPEAWSTSKSLCKHIKELLKGLNVKGLEKR